MIPSAATPETNEQVCAPGNLAEIIACLRDANLRDARLQPRGTGSRLAPYAMDGASALSLARHTGIVDLDPAEMVLTAEAGTTLAEIEEALTPHRLHLPPLLDLPPAMNTFTIPGTMGGLYSDPREVPFWPRIGRTRDHVLGIEAVRGDGTPFKAGGRVVKNVTGYDLTRFLCGSRGRYAVITRLHWRLLPRPELVLAAEYGFDDAVAAWDGLRALRASGQDPLIVAVSENATPPAHRVLVVECGRPEVARIQLAAAHDRLGGVEVQAPHTMSGEELRSVSTAAFRCDLSGDERVRVRISSAFSAWPSLLTEPLPLGAGAFAWESIFPFACFAVARWKPALPSAPSDLASLGAALATRRACVTFNHLTVPAAGTGGDGNVPEPAFAARLRRLWDPRGVLSGERP